MRILKLAALPLALLVTQGSATAALSHRSYPVVTVHVAVPVHHTVRRTDAAGTRVPPGWGLLAAGLLGAWAIGRRRIASIGNGRRQ